MFQQSLIQYNGMYQYEFYVDKNDPAFCWVGEAQW